MLLRIVGHSMEPTIHNGDTVIVQTAFPFAQLVPGMIVIRGPENPPLCHRAIRYAGLLARRYIGRFQTKGDANSRPDLGWLTKEDFVGAVVAVIEPDEVKRFPLPHL